MSGRPINESRQMAIFMGDKTYTGAAHDKCGTTERYVKGGGCAHCARVIATEQRDARKFLAAAANDAADRHVIDDTFANPVVRANHQAELDDADEALHDEMVAEARAERTDAFRESIDDLM